MKMNKIKILLLSSIIFIPEIAFCRVFIKSSRDSIFFDKLIEENVSKEIGRQTLLIDKILDVQSNQLTHIGDFLTAIGILITVFSILITAFVTYELFRLHNIRIEIKNSFKNLKTEKKFVNNIKSRFENELNIGLSRMEKFSKYVEKLQTEINNFKLDFCFYCPPEEKIKGIKEVERSIEILSKISPLLENEILISALREFNSNNYQNSISIIKEYEFENSANLTFLLGLLKYKSNEFVEANSYFFKTVELNPDFFAAYYYLYQGHKAIGLNVRKDLEFINGYDSYTIEPSKFEAKYQNIISIIILETSLGKKIGNTGYSPMIKGSIEVICEEIFKISKENSKYLALIQKCYQDVKDIMQSILKFEYS